MFYSLLVTVNLEAVFKSIVDIIYHMVMVVEITIIGEEFHGSRGYNGGGFLKIEELEINKSQVGP